MINNYPFKVTSRKYHLNSHKMQRIADYDKDGKEIMRQVNGKPYYDNYVMEMHFMTEAKAAEYAERKKKVAGYVRLHKGNFTVEESYA